MLWLYCCFSMKETEQLRWKISKWVSVCSSIAIKKPVLFKQHAGTFPGSLEFFY